MTAAPATRLVAPVAIAVTVALADLVQATISWSAYQARHGASIPGTSSAIYVFGLEAAAGVLILLLAVVAAGRSPAAAATAAWLAWLRLIAVGITAPLMIFHVGFEGPFDAADVFLMTLALIDALTGAIICTVIARATTRLAARNRAPRLSVRRPDEATAPAVDQSHRSPT
jgi:hypothetical protein